VGRDPFPVRTHWVTTTYFLKLLSLPRLRAYLGATGPLLVILGGSPKDTDSLDAGDGAAMAARLAFPAVPQPKEVRRHAPLRRTARGLRRRGFLMGLGRDRLAWRLRLPRM
jgi:hypothetical protein